MNSIKYVFYIGTIIVSCNAYGMNYSLHHGDITEEKAKYTLLALSMEASQQPKFLSFIDNGKTSHPDFKKMVEDAQANNNALNDFNKTSDQIAAERNPQRLNPQPPKMILFQITDLPTNTKATRLIPKKAFRRKKQLFMITSENGFHPNPLSERNRK